MDPLGFPARSQWPAIGLGKSPQFRAVYPGGVRGALATNRSPPPTQLDKALITKAVVGPQHGVHVDVERSSEITCPREPVTGTDVAIADGSPHRGSYLAKERKSAIGVHLQ